MATYFAVRDIQVVVPGVERARSLLARLRGVARGAATRRALAGLDERILRDIGATQRDAATQGVTLRAFYVPPPA